MSHVIKINHIELQIKSKLHCQCLFQISLELTSPIILEHNCHSIESIYLFSISVVSKHGSLHP